MLQARYLDHGWLFVEARLAGSIGTFDCPLTVYCYGCDPRTEAGCQLYEKMLADKLPLTAVKEAEEREKERQKRAKRQGHDVH
jgi:SWI/SNF-related matrix-associated actin-dependent regulator of chromatin subfamily A3